ncbi:TIGR03089 family protein [Cellulomonas fimi]|uniref:TIGR03089 family protein n=1 Tax=Cellulomonas fimi TaxID=1708 RepID=UPI00234C84A9|nr:TIGR03089 family protein [Cellulomonas fimi]MDC7122980.1 TIGR03089 family protein [Cellulomonas fimi]
MPATTITDLMTLLTRDPGRPRITWYGDDGERVELSGAVLENWVNKTTNLLVEELDAAPGTVVAVDLPGHWRTLVWALAAWRAGACVHLGVVGTADVVVTDRPAAATSAPGVVAVALPALARRFPDPLPPRAIDAAAAVMTYGDALGWVPAVQPGSAALADGERTLTHAELLAHAPEGADRVLTAAGARGDARALLAAVAVLAAGGSLVLASEQAADALRADPGRRESLAASERVTDDRLV